MLVYIGAGTAAMIAARIAFHIALAVCIAARERDKDGKRTERIIESAMAED